MFAILRQGNARNLDYADHPKVVWLVPKNQALVCNRLPDFQVLRPGRRSIVRNLNLHSNLGMLGIEVAVSSNH